MVRRRPRTALIASDAGITQDTQHTNRKKGRGSEEQRASGRRKLRPRHRRGDRGSNLILEGGRVNKAWRPLGGKGRLNPNLKTGKIVTFRLRPGGWVGNQKEWEVRAQRRTLTMAVGSGAKPLWVAHQGVIIGLKRGGPTRNRKQN